MTYGMASQTPVALLQTGRRRGQPQLLTQLSSATVSSQRLWRGGRVCHVWMCVLVIE